MALVGSETLLGKEVREVLQNRTGARVKDFAANGEGNFGEEEGEAVYVEPLSPEAIRESRFVVHAGTPEGAAKAYDIARAANGSVILIDCTGDLEGRPDTRLFDYDSARPDGSSAWLIGVPHPAAIALDMVLRRLRLAGEIKQAIANIFEPASERGKGGVSELHQQTTSLLSFKPLEKKVFDAQLTFNLLARYGEEAPTVLDAVETRIERDLATQLSREPGSIPMPSIRLLQAPVFHGYSISLWVEFKNAISTASITESLASAQIEIRSADQDAPDVVSAAGQSGLIAGDIRIDRNNPRAAWLWVVADNLKMVADTAAEIVTQLVEGGR